MTNSDGTITLSTAVDTKGVTQGVSKIKGSLSGLSTALRGVAKMMVAAFSVRAIGNFIKSSREAYEVQFENETKLATVMRQRMNATDAEIQQILNLTSAEQKLGVIGDEVQLAGLQQLATFSTTTDTLKKLTPAMNNLLAQQNGYKASTGAAVGVANLMGKVLQGQTGALTRVGITFTEAEAKVLKFGNEEQRAAMLAQVITNNVGNMNYVLAQTDIGRQQQLRNVLGDIKERFGQAAQQIAIVFLPVLQALARVLEYVARVAQAVASALAKAFGGKKTSDSIKSTNVSISQTAASQKNLAQQNNATEKSFDKVTKATNANTKANNKNKKSVKRTIADYDKLRVIQKQTQKAAKASSKPASTSGGGGGITGGGGGGGLLSGTDDGGAKLDKLTNREKQKLGIIMAVAGMFLAAIGLILLLTGHIGLGLGLLVAGAASFGAGIVLLKDSGLSQKTKDMLTKIGTISGVALVALGLILCLTGVGVPLGLGMILAGGTALAGVVALNWDYFSEKLSGAWETIKNWWNNDVMNSEVVKGLRTFYDTNIKPIADKIDARVSKLWNETLLPFWENKVKPLWEKMKPYLEKYWNNWLWPLIKTIGQVIGELFTTLGNLLSTVVDTIANLLEDLLNMFGDAADGIEALFKGDWKKAGEAGLNLMDDWNQLVADIGTGILNTLIDVVNGITGVINKFLGWIGDVIDKDWGDAIPKIPHVDRIDASKHGYRAALESAKGGGGHHSSTFSVDSITPTINNEQTIVVELDGDVLTQKVVRSQARRTVMMGV